MTPTPDPAFMHAFEYRLNQLLDRVNDLTAGRRQRLTRSLRQDDVELGIRTEDLGLDAAMKAALRVAAHEVLDAFCVHLEGALARCRSDHARTLVMAVVAIVLAENGCVLFAEKEAEQGKVSGVAFPAAETVVIFTVPDPVVDVLLWSGADTIAGQLMPKVRVVIGNGGTIPEAALIATSPAAIEADPFLEATRILTMLRETDARHGV
jgi:hypothetical protein